MLESLEKISVLDKRVAPDATTLELLTLTIEANRSPELTNYLRFFKELGKHFENPTVGCIPKVHYPIYKKHIKKGECHLNSLLVAEKSNDAFDFYYGFTDSNILDYNGLTYVKTYQHSFLVQKEDQLLFDPTISWTNVTSGDERMVVGKNYFGVCIPPKILKRAGEKTNRTYQNISYYLKEFVFVNSTETTNLIKEIKDLMLITA